MTASTGRGQHRRLALPWAWGRRAPCRVYAPRAWSGCDRGTRRAGWTTVCSRRRWPRHNPRPQRKHRRSRRRRSWGVAVRLRSSQRHSQRPAGRRSLINRRKGRLPDVPSAPAADTRRSSASLGDAGTKRRAEILLATTTVEDFDRFTSVFSTKGSEKREQHCSNSRSSGCATRGGWRNSRPVWFVKRPALRGLRRRRRQRMSRCSRR
jgi:hypothetical protein